MQFEFSFLRFNVKLLLLFIIFGFIKSSRIKFEIFKVNMNHSIDGGPYSEFAKYKEGHIVPKWDKCGSFSDQIP